MTQISTGGFVRHRDRMVAQSVFEDIRNTLIACRWMAGTTTRRVVSPYNVAAGWQLVTTTPEQVLPLLEQREDGTRAEINLIDYFPEAGGNDDENDESRKTPPNTLAVDQGELGESQLLEMGSNFTEQPYLFALAFYAASDAVALAVLNDLRDRFAGRLVCDDNIDLFDYNQPGFDFEFSSPVVRMEVDDFAYERSTSDLATPADVHMYFGRLSITDYVDSRGAASPLV